MSNNNDTLRVIIDQTRCVGAGLCVLSSGTVFDQRDEDGVVTLLQQFPEPAAYQSILEAARNCPSKAIKVEPVDSGRPEHP